MIKKLLLKLLRNELIDFAMHVKSDIFNEFTPEQLTDNYIKSINDIR